MVEDMIRELKDWYYVNYILTQLKYLLVCLYK